MRAFDIFFSYGLSLVAKRPAAEKFLAFGGNRVT